MTPTLFLHGALGSAGQFEAILAQAPDNHPVWAINLPGHGKIPAKPPFSMESFEAAVLQFLDEQHVRQVHIFGYSMGGYLALWLAWKHPDRIASIRTYGTKLDWNPEVATGMNRMFDPEKIEAKAPQLADALAKTHGDPAWKDLCWLTAAFLNDLGAGKGLTMEAFAAIECPVTIGWGDQDHVVSEAESKSVAAAIPSGQFVVLPGGKHLLEQVDTGQLIAYIF